MNTHFADRLIEAVKAKGNPICVGLDPRLNKIPSHIKAAALSEDKSPMEAAADAIVAFNEGIIDAVADIVPAVKPQIAFYELYGHHGIRAYEETLRYAKSKGLITIADAKRNDIGSTAAAYAQAFLGEVEMFEGEDEVVMPVFDADSITITPYLGYDGIRPFSDEAAKYKKGMFVLVKTSNPSGSDLQDLKLASHQEMPMHEIVATLVDSWGSDFIGKSGYSFVGAVVGATYPEEAKKLRHLMPQSIFLVPGYGAQGGSAEDVRHCFNEDGLGAIVNSSRGIIHAYEKLDGFDELKFAQASRKACEIMAEDLASVLS